MKQVNKSPLAIALRSTVVSGFAVSATVHADTLIDLTHNNPFTLQELSTGYMQTAEAGSKDKKMNEGSCGEGKCGAAMSRGSEEKTAEGKCAGNKPMPKAKKTDKNPEAKCGEGKCGGVM